MSESASSEKELIRQFRNGDPEALRVLIDAGTVRVRERLERRLPAWLSRRVSVSDLVQEACLTAFERREEFTGQKAERRPAV